MYYQSENIIRNVRNNQSAGGAVININSGKIEVAFLQPSLGVFPAQPLTG